MLDIAKQQLQGDEMSVSAQAESLIDTVLGFHGQPVYSSVEAGIARKKWLFRIAFPLVRVLSRSRLANMAMLLAVLLGYRAFRHPDPDCTVFQFGQSRNNIVSFDRLNACLSEAALAKTSINGRMASLWERVSAALALGSVWQAAGVLRRHRHGRALPHVQSVIAVAAMLHYRSHPLPESVKVLCIASDHAPICQALLFLAAKSGRETCYIQHAPVTEYFPPLAYDLAILYDKASAKAYEGAARRTGTTASSRIVYLPPFPREFEPPLLSTPPYVVGICLSFLPQVPRLAAQIDEMAAHASVNGIILRKHPRCTLDLSHLTRHPLVSLQPKGETADTFFDQVDVVLVPNSGVAIEALHRGRPTFFTPGADDIPDDYYGFVANGILPEFRAELLDDRDSLLDFFNAEWQLRFGEQDETVHTPLASARKKVREAFMQLI